VKRYEGLFILKTGGREEALKETIDRIAAEIASAGGKVETIQKMDKKTFTRVADRKQTAGFYVNIVFEGQPAIVAQLQRRFVNDEEIFRMLVTLAQAPKPVAIPTT
jgi:ribosomal protein S6